MEPTKIVDMIMNKAASILTLEKEKVGADMFNHLENEPEQTEDETDNGTD